VTIPEPPVVFDARNAALEAAILADPESPEPWLVFGDWLQQQGDPRGVLIMRCAAQRAAPKDPKLQRLLEVRLERFPEYFHGVLGKQGITLRWGFIHRIAMLAFDRGPGAPRLEQCLRARPQGRFVNTIELTVPDLDRCVQVIGELAPETLRSLALVGTDRVKDLEPLVEHIGRLRQLSLIAGLSSRAFATLVDAPMPNVELLALRGDDTPALRAVLARTDLHELVLDYVTPALLDMVAELVPNLVALGVRALDSVSALHLLDHLVRFPKLVTLAGSFMRIDQNVAATLRTKLAVTDFLERYTFSALSK
jgi:uncharacterized protein (TIGR02996 family)